MSITARIVILSTDESLREEAEIAFAAIGDDAPRFRFVSSPNQLFDVLRNQPIDLVLAEFPANPKELSSLLRQIYTSPMPPQVAAILRPEGFDESVNESTVLIDALRDGVCDFLRRPLSTVDLERLFRTNTHSDDDQNSANRNQFGRVVSFVSNKGGVGKSTLATNSGVAIARRGKQSVLLIDGSIQMGVAAALLDVTPNATLTDLARESDRLDPTMIRQIAAVHSSGLHLLAAPADAVEAMEIDDVLMARIITMARQTYDVVIVDTFPMFDRVVIAALDLSDRVYVVLENVLPTLLGGIKLLDVLERIGYPAKRQSIILNRQQRVTGSLSINDVADRMQREINHVLPFDKRVVAAANCGVPIAMAKIRFSGFSRALEKLADDVAGLIGDNSSRLELAEEPLVEVNNAVLNEPIADVYNADDSREIQR